MDDIRVGKAYSSVAEMFSSQFPEESEAADAFGRKCESQRISQVLFLIRTQHGVSREEMAGRMGVTPGKIAKIEDHGDQVLFNDVIDYAKALGYNPVMQFSSYSMNLAGLIRYYLEGVAKAMGELKHLADGDGSISRGVVEHFTQALGEMLGKVLPAWQEQMARASNGEQTEQRATGFHVDIQDESLEPTLR